MNFFKAVPEPFQNLIQPLALAALREVGPDEVPILESSFADLLEAATKAPVRNSEETLAFGTQDLVLLAPVAVLLAKEAIVFLWQESKTAATAEFVEYLRRRMRGLLKESSAKKPAPLSHEQLRRLERVLLRESKRYGLPVELSRTVADATIRSLVV